MADDTPVTQNEIFFPKGKGGVLSASGRTVFVPMVGVWNHSPDPVAIASCGWVRTQRSGCPIAAIPAPCKRS